GREARPREALLGGIRAGVAAGSRETRAWIMAALHRFGAAAVPVELESAISPGEFDVLVVDSCDPDFQDRGIPVVRLCWTRRAARTGDLTLLKPVAPSRIVAAVKAITTGNLGRLATACATPEKPVVEGSEEFAGARVLAVEDHPVNQKLLRRMLEW